MTTPEVLATAAVVVSLISTAAAWTAIVLNRKAVRDSIRAQVNIAARNSRANVVSANRQRWIDAIRDDISQIISTRSQIEALKVAGSFSPQGVDALQKEARDLRANLVMLKARVRMRLNHSEDDHLKLLDVLETFDALGAQVEGELDEISRKIFRAEWVRLKEEASGLERFAEGVTRPKISADSPNKEGPPANL